MAFIIGGLVSLAFASIVAVVLVRTRRQQRSAEYDEEARRRLDEETKLRAIEKAHQVVEQEARRKAEAEARGRADDEARVAAEQEAARKAEQETRLAAEQEARRNAEAEARRRVDDETRVAAAQEAERKAAEEARLAAEREACRQAEEEARLAAEWEAERKAVAERETEHKAGEEARLAAEQIALREAEAEARRQAEEQTRVTAEREAARKAGEESRLAAEREARRQSEEEARLAAAQEAERKAKEEVRAAIKQEARRKAEVEARSRAEEEAGVAELQAQRRAQEQAGVRTPQSKHQAPRDEQARYEAHEDVPHPGDVGPRAPRQYRPAARVPAGPRGTTPISAERERGESRDRAMPIEVRLVFERMGFCRVSLLPRRAAGMPVELAVTGSGNPPELVALQDEWYQDVVLPDLGQLLREGVEWVASLPEIGHIRSSLSGRELYVLARHSEIAGFVSTQRLILGEEHVVLCVADRLSEVRATIALTGSSEPTLLNSDSGVPAGWVGLRGVAPRTPIAPSSTGEILDALRPLAEVEIVLEGGIRIERRAWLNGYPPRVRLRGVASAIGAVTIDGREATLNPDGDYVVPGWDSPGEHSVYCTSDSRTYEIRSGAEDWESWDAYTWSLGELGAGGTQSRPAICGVLVRPPRTVRSDCRAIVVPASNPVLIGAVPGEIEICTRRSDVRAGFCVGFPWFEAVWAIPARVLRRDNHTARALLIGTPRPVAEGEQQPITHGAGQFRFHQGRSRAGNTWSAAIIGAQRKGLRTEPSRAEIADLWKTYERRAKAFRRSGR